MTEQEILINGKAYVELDVMLSTKAHVSDFMPKSQDLEVIVRGFKPPLTTSIFSTNHLIVSCYVPVQNVEAFNTHAIKTYYK